MGATFRLTMTQQNNSNSGLACPKIGSFNCNGMGNPSKRNLVLNWLKNKPEQIICLQETHSTPQVETDWKNSWGGDIIFNHGTSNSTGIAFLVKPNAANLTINNHRNISQGRATLVELEYDSLKLCLVNVYCPNNDDVSFLENIFLETLSRARDDQIIFVGDWNTVLNNMLDKQGGSTTHANSRCQNFLNESISDYGFSDIFRLNKGAEARVFTHFNKKYKTQSRLDFFLIQDSLVNLPVCDTEISHGYKSDHSYISLSLQGSTIAHGKGYWKINNSHLLDQNFINEIKKIIQNTKEDSFDSYRGLWDVIKIKIKQFAMTFGKKKKNETTVKKEKLKKDIEDCKNDPNLTNCTILQKKLFEAELDLNHLIDLEVRGAITRSRVRWTEEGERSTKYFFGLEKSNGKKKSISKLIDNDGNELTDQNNISSHVVNFYQNLYNSTNPSPTEIDNYVTSSELEQIPQEITETLEGPISLHEMDAIVNKLTNNKSPGWDGLSAEFYKTFWLDIRQIIYDCYLESIDSGCLSPSQRIGILTLIPKPKSPVELNYIKNWRPITLLNIDYKIFTHIAKNRIMKAIPSIISKTQSGFQAGRSTSDNLILMSMVLESFNNDSEQEGLLLQIDFEKCFDSVEHKFVFSTFEKLGFSDYIIKLIKVAFQACSSYANINGFLSAPIYILRGLHQGSPLSPILFLLVAQTFSNKLQINPNIRGLNISGVEILQSLFADDTDLFLKASIESVKAVMVELRTFAQYSGCKANIDKTRCIPLGRARFNTSLLASLKNVYGDDFITNNFTALGITYRNDGSLRDIVNSNYNDKLIKVRSWINRWNKRDLTLMGKCTIIKTLLFSQLTYLVSPLPRPDASFIRIFDTTIFHFLWGCKRDKIKREIITRNKEHGGLGLFYLSDFIIGLKTSLISKLLNNSFRHTWKEIMIKQLKFPNHITISVENGLAKINCHFTQDVLNCYTEWKISSANAALGSIDHCVWSNPAITDIGSKLWNKHLIDKGIFYISDFLSIDQSTLLNYDMFINKWELTPNTTISKTDYCNIIMGIRRYNCPSVNNRNIEFVDSNIKLQFLHPSTGQVKGSKIREKMYNCICPNDLLPLRQWVNDLNSQPIDWAVVLSNLFFFVSKNFKLIQFQYKLLMRITTCRYMRHKMKIVTDTPMCSLCNTYLETIPHIYLHCIHTNSFTKILEDFIKRKVDRNYRDPTKINFIVCNHTSQIINYFNIVAKWYILAKDFRQGKCRSGRVILSYLSFH